MDTAKRVHVYAHQRPGVTFTPKQQRRLAKKARRELTLVEGKRFGISRHEGETMDAFSERTRYANRVFLLSMSGATASKDRLLRKWMKEVKPQAPVVSFRRRVAQAMRRLTEEARKVVGTGHVSAADPVA